MKFIYNTTPLSYPEYPISQLAKNTLSKEWYSTIITPSLEQVSKDILSVSTQSIYPPISYLFEAFYKIPSPKNVRVIIIGQDPYPGEFYVDGNSIPLATGVAFAMPPNARVPGSLSNMYKKIQQETGKKMTDVNDGTLEGWINQGVLLFNTSMTVVAGKPTSHMWVWKKYSKELVQRLSENIPNAVWLLMGGYARGFVDVIGGTNKIITCPHPSPLSAQLFFRGGNCFTKVNEMLEGKPIDWSINI